MPKIEFTQAEVDSYANESYKYCYHDQCKNDAQELKVHADGEKPVLLLCTRRPNEPLEVKCYREEIWEPITREPIAKVISSLQKIRRSPDWVIKYPDQTEFTLIAEGGELNDYCESNFPYFRSLTNWLFALYLRKYLIDANSVIFIRPLEMTDQFQYVQPVATIFDSCHVIEMVEDDYAVLWNPLGCGYNDDKNVYQRGKSFYIVTTQTILKYDEMASGKFALAEEYPHGLGILPAFKTPAMIKDACEGRFYNQSRIEGMLCHLNEAAREYSDLQAAKVNHMYPERWEFTQNDCGDCQGTGRRTNPLFIFGDPLCTATPQIDCVTCHGRGFKVAGPYAKIMVRPANGSLEGAQLPIPPAGYIEKDVEIIKVQEQSVDAHIYKALSSVNMEYLAQVPVVQSGVAKEVDRSESANTVHSVAEDIVAAMDRIYFIIAKYRYGHLYSDEEIMNMLPQIPVPERFDLMTAAQSLTEIKLAKDGKANPLILNAMERDFAEKRFNTDPEIADQLLLELELDPLPNISEDDKNSRLQNSGITQETYVISSNIHEFVERALIDDPNFAALRPELQRDKMMEYATEMINADSTASKIITLGNAEPVVTGNNQDNQQIAQDVQSAATGSTAVNAQGSAQGTQAA